jgi:hypothetical protein
MPGLTRRRFLVVGLGSAAILSAAGWWAMRPGRPAAGLRTLDEDGAAFVTALVPAVLAGSLPKEDAARREAIRDTVAAFDRAVSGLTPAVQSELGQLFALVTIAPSRRLIAGVARPWAEASVEEVSAFLAGWRNGRLDLMRAGYQALTQLLIAAWYGNPAAWAAIGYAGPPSLGEKPA